MNARAIVAVVIALGVWLASPARASAQVYTGRIDVQVQDDSGGILPGTTVELTGPLTQTAVTDSVGQAHFLNLPLGTYKVTAHLAGFADYASPPLVVAAGAAVPLRVTLGVGGVQEEVVVSGEAPLIDTRKQTTGLNLSQEELQQLPSTRDWSSAAQSVPSVSTDRVNVGGSESGSQSNMFAKGASNLQNTVNVDGVVVTDGSASTAMASPDFDMFQEIQVTTGGASTSNPSAGVQVNLVLKSGGNTAHGSTRFLFENGSLQSDNLNDALKAELGTEQGNRIDRYNDYGFEAGGPVLRDRWWAWGGAGKLDLENVTLNGYPDPTTLSTIAFKTSLQVTPSIRPSFSYFRTRYDKPQYGIGPSVPPEVALHLIVGSDLYKAESNFVIGKGLFVTARASYMKVDQSFTPASGLGPDAYRDPGGVWRNGYFYGVSGRDQTAAAADASYFKGRHELKLGFSWRKTPIDSMSTVSSASHIYTIDLPNYDATGMMIAFVAQPWSSSTDGRFLGLYAGDTVTFKRATLTAALRYDRSSGSVLPTCMPAVAGFTQYLPEKCAPAVKDALVYSLPSPRVGFSYQLGAKQQTQVRGSYALLSSLLKTRDVRMVSGITYSSVYYLAIDQNHDGIGQTHEFVMPLGMYGFDPANPSDASKSVNRIDPSIKTPYTHEAVIGFDHELMPQFSLSASLTYRRFVNLSWTPLIGIRAGDYVAGTPVTGTLFGQSYSVPNYYLPNGLLPPGMGKELVTRDGYHQTYLGLEVSATKRLSDRWMARLGFSTNSHKEYFEGPASLSDPTPNPASPNISGGQVVFATQSAQKASLMNYVVQPRYQFIANGLYQAPWDVQLSASFLARQGYSIPYYYGNVAGPPGMYPAFKEVLIAPAIDRYRLPTVFNADFRLQKSVQLRSRLNAVLSVDVFNFLNSATVLGRQPDQSLTGVTGFNAVQQIMSPRVARLGVRLTF